MVEIPKIHATIWSEFAHFPKFQNDPRLAGIRLNSAMADTEQLSMSVRTIDPLNTVPMFVDFKGRQPRVEEASTRDGNLVLRMNHPLAVDLPTGVAFKAEKDFAVLQGLEDGGRTLVFKGGPRFKVKTGESIHIMDDSFRIVIPDSIFSQQEKDKIAAVAPFCKNFYLSYVETQRDLDEFLELVGSEAFVWLKIETRDGLKFVANDFKKKDNVGLVGARGDLYIEVLRPHEILAAMKLIVEKDPGAMAASRIFLSIIGYKNPLVTYLLTKHPEDRDDVIVNELIAPSIHPECHDFEELAWLYDLGYRNYLLCDEICLESDMLDIALNAFQAFANYYPQVVAESKKTGGFSIKKLFRSFMWK